MYTDRACMNNSSDEAQAGYGAWYGEDDPRNMSGRVQHSVQSNQTGELMAVLQVVKRHDPEGDLQIITDSKYVIEGLTKHLHRWEARGWADVSNGDMFKIIVAWARRWSGETYLKWTKGHNGTRGNEEADRLASKGTGQPRALDSNDMAHPGPERKAGATLAHLKQQDLYRTIHNKRRQPTRAGSVRNLENIQECTRAIFKVRPTTESVWTATKHKDLTRKTQDFLWKSTQNTYKIGSYWTRIEGYQDRGVCLLCNKVEDMEHILTKCRAGTCKEAWRLANEMWAKRHQSELPNTLGGMLGCGLASFTDEDRPDKGKNRLYRILVSETAYLIWKLRNERRIRDEEGPVQKDTEVSTRWTNTLNKRLMMDRMLTNKARFQKNTLDDKLVRNTWSRCLRDEEVLPANWPMSRGVLVGISAVRPPGRAG